MTTDNVRIKDLPKDLPDDLPAWMRPRRRVIDWGLVIILVASLFIGLPLITRHAIPAGNDAELYAMRSLEVARLVRDGILFSRWAPDLNYTFGSPLFNYLAPLPYYLPGYHQALTDTGSIDSVNEWLALAILAAGTGMYFFARQRWGAPAGMIAALVYVFSPPVALNLPYLVGDLAPLMALGFLPWVLWSLDRLWLTPNRRNLFVATFPLVWLILSDPRVAGLSLPILLIALATRRGSPSPALLFMLVALSAAMLTAFFWLPALAERDQIRWTPVVADRAPDMIPLAESLGMPHLDSRILNEPVYRGIGVGTGLAALAGAVALGWRVRRRVVPVPLDGAAFLIAGLIFLGVSTPAFSSLWPSPSDFQGALPYQAILIAVFCLAAASAQAVHLVGAVAERWRGVALAALCLIAPLAASSTLHFPQRLSRSGELDYVASIQDELEGYHIGTFRDGVLLPALATVLPTPPSNLIANLQGDTFSRINRRSFGASSQINLIEHTLQSDRYVFDMNSPDAVEFNTLYYPGWTYSLNGERYDAQPSPAGSVSVHMSTGTGELAVWLEGTPIRYLAWFVTFAGLIVLFLAARRLSPMLAAEDHEHSRPASAGLLPGRQALTLALVLALVASAVVWEHQRAPDSGIGDMTGIAPVPSTFSGGIGLLGYDLPAPEDHTIHLTLFWQADGTGANSSQPSVRLVTADGQQIAATSVHRYPGGIPASHWQPGDIVRDDFALAVPPDLQPASYRLKVQVSMCDSVVLVPCTDLSTASTAGPNDPGASGAILIPQSITISAQGAVEVSAK